MFGGLTVFILMIWDDAVDGSNWAGALAGNCAVLIGCSLVLIAINRICGRTRGLTAKLINAFIFVTITGCFILSTLVIWGVTGTDAAFKAILTISILTVAAFIFVPIANAIQKPQA